MRAQLKGLYTIEMGDPSTFVPADPSKFVLYLRTMIGPEGEPGEESFDLTVCTPAWLQGNLDPKEPLMGSGYLIVRDFDYARIKQRIIRFISTCSGETWDAIACKLGRLGNWEFEDYREYEDAP